MDAEGEGVIDGQQLAARIEELPLDVADALRPVRAPPTPRTAAPRTAAPRTTLTLTLALTLTLTPSPLRVDCSPTIY